MKHIELHIECYKADDKLLRLGIASESDSEWRRCTVPLDAIMLIYPAKEGGTMIIIGCDDYLFRESYIDIIEQIKKL